MAIKAIVFPNTGVQATYELNGDGSVNLVSVVTKGNYVTNYGRKEGFLQIYRPIQCR